MLPNELVKEAIAPAFVPAVAAAASQSQPGVLTKPSIVSPGAGHDEHGSEEEEREVFEL
jgi:hypothetical protein